jgi:hypothetical protein
MKGIKAFKFIFFLIAIKSFAAREIEFANNVFVMHSNALVLIGEILLQVNVHSDKY